MSKRWLLGMLAVLVVVIASCGIPEDGSPRALEADDLPTELTEPPATPSPTPTEVPIATTTVLIYLVDADQFVVGVERDLPVPLLFKSVIEELILGPTQQEADEQGLTSVLPLETIVLDVELVDDTLVINLAEGTLQEIGSELLTIGIAQLVYTATELDGIDQVLIQIEGEFRTLPTDEGDTQDRVSRDLYRSFDPDFVPPPTPTPTPTPEPTPTPTPTPSPAPRHPHRRHSRPNEDDGVIVAIDAGTTGVRAVAVDEQGRHQGSSYRELTQHFPRPGWVEHDAEEIWTATQLTMAELVAGLDEPIAAIGITNQRETVVAWSRRTGTPLHRAIVWQDRRTAPRCRELADAGQLPIVRRRTGLVLDPYFSASKIEWLLTEGGVDAGPDLAVGTVDSWLVHKLTGGATHVTEPGNASRTMLFDIEALAWSEELAELFSVPLSALPEVRPSSGDLGVTAADTAVGAGIPIAGIAGDQQAALFGQACFGPGDTKNTYGTGSFVLMNVGERCPPPAEGLLTTIGWQLEVGGPVTYALEGAVFVTGAAVQWLRDGLGIIDDAADLEPLARSCEDTGGVVVVPAFTGLGSPWWDPDARGTIVGITRGTGRAELARAVVEAMVHQTRDVVDLMSEVGGHPITRLRVDGGASVMGLLLQLQADQLGVPVARPTVAETTAHGAAQLAGLGAGVWSSTDELADQWRLDVEVAPTGDRADLDARHARWRDAVSRSLSRGR